MQLGGEVQSAIADYYQRESCVLAGPAKSAAAGDTVGFLKALSDLKSAKGLQAMSMAACEQLPVLNETTSGRCLVPVCEYFAKLAEEALDSEIKEERHSALEESRKDPAARAANLIHFARIGDIGAFRRLSETKVTQNEKKDYSNLLAAAQSESLLATAYNRAALNTLQDVWKLSRKALRRDDQPEDGNKADKIYAMQIAVYRLKEDVEGAGSALRNHEQFAILVAFLKDAFWRAEENAPFELRKNIDLIGKAVSAFKDIQENSGR